MPLSQYLASPERVSGNPVVVELLEGLTAPQKYINPKFLYDERGSELFHLITRLTEYYPSRTERQILQDNARAIAESIGRGSVLIEPGAGSCEKVKYLLDDLAPAAYVPQDISAEHLLSSVSVLGQSYPWLKVYPVIGDFSGSIDLPEALPEGRKVVFYPGSTIGNFEPEQAACFLRDMRELIGETGGLLIGVDLQKDPAILHAAYNDAAGVTAAFNLNVIANVNRILGTDIALDAFSHEAFYNTNENRIEMHLVSHQNKTTYCNGTHLHFRKGEAICTEYSYKYTLDSFDQLAEKAGFMRRTSWLDGSRYFAVHYYV